MNIRNLFISVISLCVMILIGCGEKNEPVDKGRGSLYGSVTDFATGMPVANANVSLRPGGETTLTGYDGIYEFLNLPNGKYSIVVTKAEYTDLIDDKIISIDNGRRMRRDVQIMKQYSNLSITDTEGVNINSLDFGSDSYITNRPFNIFNNGAVNISCSIIYSCSWIKSVSSVPDRIKPGQNITVNVEIDRSKLAVGNNETLLYITSNNGNNILKVCAMRPDGILPNVLTLPVTYFDGTITPWCDTFHARVTTEGVPAYHSRGFCFSSTNKEPTINDNRIDIPGTGLGEFSYTYRNFPYNTQTYYVRAWVMYDSDNKIQYGNVQSFIYNNV